MRIVPEIVASDAIVGVKLVRLNAIGDERGRFMETFRTGWFPERSWETVQTNRSDSRAGVLRGLHYHFKQVDYWCLMGGHLRVGMADLRRNSPTFGASQIVDIDEENPQGIFIPSGVAHGFYAATDVTLTYVVDRYYDGSDEFGVAWNDPTLQVPWQVADPLLSPRDAANPFLAEIKTQDLPVFQA